MTDVRDWLMATIDRAARVQMRNPILCADGFSMSVQASRYHYCSPRNDAGPWTHVEVGFPTAREPLLLPYVEDDRADPTETVYAQVPTTVIDAVIAAHGGWAKEAA